jgi:hypothetical protein
MRISNKKTQKAIQELKEGRGIKSESIGDFWKKMEMNPHDPTYPAACDRAYHVISLSRKHDKHDRKRQDM